MNEREVGSPGGQAGGSWLGGSWLGQGSVQKTLEETQFGREEKEMGNMGAREGRSWRNSLFPSGRRVRGINHLDLIILRETPRPGFSGSKIGWWVT